jgi:hypothetical protein
VKLSTRLIIGATVIALGIGMIGLGFLEQESNILQVHELLADPPAHSVGSWTLIGMPQPELLASVAGGAGQANPAYNESLQHVIRWEGAAGTHISSITTTVRGPDDAGISYWHLENRTRIPGSAAAATTTNASWQITAPHVVFQIHGFMEGGAPPVIWGVYEGVLTTPLQPKPSQFVGKLSHTGPGAIVMPGEAVVYMVEEYTAGCSSKFLPPDVADEYADDDDITA